MACDELQQRSELLLVIGDKRCVIEEAWDERVLH
jgi:hypothetical protein